MSEADAQQFVDRPGAKADFLLFGEDSGSDDMLAQFAPDRYWVSPAGLGMRGAVQLANAKLDEDGMKGFPPRVDPEHFEDTTDEFYADIPMADVRNGGAHRLESCRLTLPD